MVGPVARGTLRFVVGRIARGVVVGFGFVAASFFVAVAWGNWAAWLVAAVVNVAAFVSEVRTELVRQRTIDEELTAERHKRNRRETALAELG